ncbi:MAG: hypothetical protein J7527_12420 [Chitinophagaceae bacterium]|nr:hypothetical protein [Chitinophagaceae bacterium]
MKKAALSRVSIYGIVMVCLTGCAEHRSAIWTSNTRNMFDPTMIFFTGVTPIEEKLHGNDVRINGQLIYNFDESAIHPLFPGAAVKPVWMHFENPDSILHAFLMKHDQSIVAVTGRLDTAGKMFDPYNRH